MLDYPSDEPLSVRLVRDTLVPVVREAVGGRDKSSALSVPRSAQGPSPAPKNSEYRVRRAAGRGDADCPGVRLDRAVSGHPLSAG